MDKLKVMVLFGGLSEEHEVSVKSAKQIARSLDAEKYDPLYVYLNRDGSWLLVDGPDGDLSLGRRATPCVDPTARGMLALADGRWEALAVDVALPILHGRFGEDGTVQGLLSLCSIPCAGCGLAASALAMDKSLCYAVASGAGVAVPRFALWRAGDAASAGALRYPVFVKPCRSGSSFGVNRVCDPGALRGALEEALQWDDKVLIEEEVEGIEIGCAMLGPADAPFIGAIDQIELSGGFFRIHQEKKPEQGSENAVIRVPARISEAARARVEEVARTVYRALDCQGLARVDLFLRPDGQVVLNEVNTLPGFTAYSRYPRMMAAAGLSLSDVADRLIALALARAGRNTL